MQINDLPDFAALKQIADALWKIGDTRGAAVMIGAGFSRNAILPSPTSQKPPLWTDFLKAMLEKLYPNGSQSSDNPLRLAEEYRAAYGTPALEGFIRNLVPDEQWEPGILHKKLIDLPWNDVLTTNWDTLLEKSASNSLLCNYEIVRTPADIARTRSPRIVKLHGSLPSHTPFIFSEEDYRTYPVKFSPFVNLVRQVLLENDLCLIGFSGDDPNFAQWAGWVRDELKISARRIFLIGALNLSPTKRQYLEARSITPIDLSPLFKNTADIDPHTEATKCVLEFFKKSKPEPISHWPNDELEKQIKNENIDTPADGNQQSGTHKSITNPVVAAQRIKQKIPLLSKLRTSYPGWVICPHDRRMRLRWCIDSIHPGIIKALEHLEDQERARVLYEIAWAHDIAYWPLPAYLIEQLGEVVDGKYNSTLPVQERRHVALVLLRTARENADDGIFSKWESWLQQNSFGDTDAESGLAYEKCIRARDRLDFELIQNLAHKIRGNDPIWQLRRASMCAELGEFETAKSLIRQCTHDLQARHMKDRSSIWVLSRLAWSALLSHALRWETSKKENDQESSSDIYATGDWPTNFKDSKCDPWDELNSIDNDITSALEKQLTDSKTVQPKFDAGHYSDKSGSIHFQSGTVVPIGHQLRCVINNVGLPMSLDFVGLTGHRLVRSLPLEDWNSASVFLHNIRILSKADEKAIDRHFGRIDVARIPADIIAALIQPLRNSIAFGSRRFIERASAGTPERYDTFWVDRVRNLTEVLSRLVVRLPSNEAKAIFYEACTYASSVAWSHWWLFEHLDNLLRRSVEAMPPKERAELTLSILNIPLPCEHNIAGMVRDWPEIIETAELKQTVRAPDDRGWNERVSKLIEIVRGNVELSRHNAALRLYCLHSNNLLLAEEKTSFANALWSQRENDESLPKNTSLYPWVFLELPEISLGTAERIFRRVYFEQFNATSASSAETLETIRGASLLKNGKACIPTREQAPLMLKIILDRKPAPNPPKFPDFSNNEKNCLVVIGSVIADAILPVFSPSTLTPEENQRLIDWVENGGIPSSMEILPALVRLDSNLYTFAEEKLRRGLASRQQDSLRAALSGVNRWITMSSSDALFPLPQSLARAVVGIVANRRHPLLHFAIHTAKTLAQNKLLTDEEIATLIDSLEDLQYETNYANWDETHPETHCISFIRSNCVCLSQTLLNAGHSAPQLTRWLNEAKTDPVPEVRYALEFKVL